MGGGGGGEDVEEGIRGCNGSLVGKIIGQNWQISQGSRISQIMLGVTLGK